jgi:hypothetical protein
MGIFVPKLIAASVVAPAMYFLVIPMWQSALQLTWNHGVTAVALAALWALLVPTYYRHWRALKQVAVDDRFLFVSSYGGSDEVVVPLTDIVSVTQWRGDWFRPVTIELRIPSRLGQRIKFQPARGLEHGWDFQESNLVRDLRRMAKLQA